MGHLCSFAGNNKKRELYRNMQVFVRDNNIDKALRILKKRMQREGVFRELRAKRAYEKPSEKRIRKTAEAVRRRRKWERKKALRETG